MSKRLQSVDHYDNGSSISTNRNTAQALCPRRSIKVHLGGFLGVNVFTLKSDTVSYLRNADEESEACNAL